MHSSLTVVIFSVATAASISSLVAAPTGLSFRALEYRQPRDPLSPSNQSADIVEHTPPAELASATDMLDSVVPSGMPRAAAEAVLQRAGAQCRPRGSTTERCSYFDVETRDEYVDAVHWNVDLHLASDLVSSVSVDRSWVRD